MGGKGVYGDFILINYYSVTVLYPQLIVLRERKGNT